MLDRRQFLTYLGMGTYSMLSSGAFGATAEFPVKRPRRKPRGFAPITASDRDELILASGFRYDVVASAGDALGSKGPLGDETFGFDNDFIAYFPIDALSGGKNPSDGLLWINHEFVHPLLVSGYDGKKSRTAAQVQKEKAAVGGSIVHVSRKNGKWSRIPDPKHTRRFNALYPEIETTGPAHAKVPKGRGTLANCSGGRTPWFTALSCEENFHLFNPANGLNWAAASGQAIDEQQYGWVVEVDPFGELPPQKHTALGRFAHENAAVGFGRNGKIVVYMGDDDQDQYLYKFVSHGKYEAKASRADRRKLLSEGVLYAADFAKCRWLPLDLERNPALKKAGFDSQADISMRTREAAKAAGATPIDRPEDCEIHPRDGSVYVSLTNNKKHGNFFGQIVRLVESGDDAEAETFRFEIFLAGGPQSGLASPDNLVFDRNGNLWVTCDVSGAELNQTNAYASFKNNGLFFVSTHGADAGSAYQFASAPIQAELTGPWFNESFDTLFLSVQHPGEETRDLSNPTSRWPKGPLPKPSVVAIQGF